MRHVLLVTYYFPPSGGSGVQRPLKFARYLPEFGCKVSVLTVRPESAAYTDLDPELEQELPQGVSVLRTDSSDPYTLYSRLTGKAKKQAIGIGFVSDKEPGPAERLARWIRGNFFIPDARKGWVRYAVRAAEEMVQKEAVDTIITSGPPHSSHLIGYRLSRLCDAAWIVDLRDAWPSDSYGHLFPMTRLARARDLALRSRVFNAADMIMAVSDSIATSAQAITKTPVKVLPNGFDRNDFDGAALRLSSDFCIVFAGHMPAEQSPDVLFDIIAGDRERYAQIGLQLHLIGNMSAEVLETIRAKSLDAFVHLTPYVPHDEAVRWMCGADLLLLPINRVPSPEGIITGKLYEYLASGKPILCLGPPDGDAAVTIRNAGGGWTYAHDDSQGVRSCLDTAIDAFTDREPIAGAPPEAISGFDRRALAEKLAVWIHSESGETGGSSSGSES